MKKIISRYFFIPTLFLLLISLNFNNGITEAANTHSVDFERGSSQYLSTSGLTGLTSGGNITLEAWFKPESTPSTNSTHAIVSSNGGGTSPYNEYKIVYENDNGTVKIRYGRAQSCITNNFVDHTTTLSNGTWYHVALTYDGTTLRGYLDGSEVASGSISGNGSYCGPDSTWIGALDSGGGTAFFDGLIDEVRIWSTVRTQTEISDDRSRELNGNESGLNAYWKLNNNLSDSTSNGYNLTNNNSAAHSSDTSFPAFSPILKVRKSANESVTSSTVLQNDDHLKLSLAESKTYIIDGVLFASSTSATPDIIIGFYGQTGSTITIGYTNDVNEMVLGSGATSARITLPANNPTSIHIKGTVVTGSTSGDFQLKWAQASSNASPTMVTAGSYLRAEEI